MHHKIRHHPPFPRFGAPCRFESSGSHTVVCPTQRSNLSCLGQCTPQPWISNCTYNLIVQHPSSCDGRALYHASKPHACRPCNSGCRASRGHHTQHRSSNNRRSGHRYRCSCDSLCNIIHNRHASCTTHTPHSIPPARNKALQRALGRKLAGPAATDIAHAAADLAQQRRDWPIHGPDISSPFTIR